MSMQAIENAFKIISASLKTGKFAKHELTFIRDMSKAITNVTQKVLDRAEKKDVVGVIEN